MQEVGGAGLNKPYSTGIGGGCRFEIVQKKHPVAALEVAEMEPAF
jgi:hypothetical protein